MTPSVSVVMSVFNGEPYLQQSIESILNQTFQDFEFIIINDGSTDNSWEIIKEYARKDSCVVPISHKNLGLTNSLNKGLAIAKGKYIARQDADDISEISRLEKQIKWFEKHREGILCGTWAKRKKINNYFTIRLRNNPTSHKKIIQLLKHRNSFNHSSVMFKKMISGNSFLYNENIKYAQDYELWSRMAKFGELGNIDEYCVTLLLRKDNISNSQFVNQRCFAILIALINNFPELNEILQDNHLDAKNTITRLFSNEKYSDAISLLLYLYRIKINGETPSFFKLSKTSYKVIFSHFNVYKYSIIKNSFFAN